MSKLWIALCHPALAVEALQVAKAAGEHFDSTHLVYEDHRAWKRIRLNEIGADFTSIHPIGESKLPHGILGALATRQALKRQIAQVDRLGIGPADCLILFSALTLFANVMLSRSNGAHRLLAVSRKKFIDFNQEPDARYRETSGGWISRRVLLPSLGLYPTLNLRLKQRGAGDGERLRRFPGPLHRYFDRVLVTDNPGATPMENLPSNVTQVVFPQIQYLRKSGTANQATRRLVPFFGTPFLALRNIAIDDYVRTLNACLDYLRRHFEAQFIYRPHPAETAECEKLDLEGFEIQNDREPAELFFLRNAEAIEAVFSVSSTVSRNAFLLGFQSYALWKVFPFEQRARDYFASVMGDVPKEFYVESLEQGPQRFESKYGGEERTQEFIRKVERSLR